MADKVTWSVSILVLSMLVAALALPLAARAETTAEWTVMVYLDGDNNLDPDSVNDVNEMMMVGSTDKVNVLILWDRYNEPAYLYKVTNGDVELLDGLTVRGMPVNGQEISMADWEVLEAFVAYGKANMPANHYIVDLWDHGNAFGYACWDDHAAPEWETPDRAISLDQAVMALAGGGMTDILTYDGCTIGMAEIAYQLSLVPADLDVQIGYLVASEEYIPNAGYAYNQILEDMNSASDTSAPAIAKLLVDDYAACYSPKGQAKGSSTVNLASADLAKIRDIVPKLKSLTDALVEGLQMDFDLYHHLISEARGDANLGWSLNGWDKRVDLGTFLYSLAGNLDDPVAKQLAIDAFGALKESVYAANTPALDSQSAYGLGIWFPTSYRSLGNANNGGFWTLEMYEDSFDFASDAGWLSFLHAYWGK